MNIDFRGVERSVELIQEWLVPWRRAHARKMARIKENECRARIALLESEIAEKTAKVLQVSEGLEGIRAKAAQERAKAEKLQLENQMLEVELKKEIMKLVISMVKELASGLDEVGRLEYAMKLFPHVDKLLSSPISLDENSPES